MRGEARVINLSHASVFVGTATMLTIMVNKTQQYILFNCEKLRFK